MRRSSKLVLHTTKLSPGALSPLMTRPMRSAHFACRKEEQEGGEARRLMRTHLCSVTHFGRATTLFLFFCLEMSQYSHQNASISFAGASEGAAGCCSVIGGGNGEGAASTVRNPGGKKAFCSFKRKEVPVAGDSAAGGAAGEAGAVSSAAAGDGEGGVWSAGCTCYESHQYKKKNTHTHIHTIVGPGPLLW